MYVTTAQPAIDLGRRFRPRTLGALVRSTQPAIDLGRRFRPRALGDMTYGQAVNSSAQILATSWQDVADPAQYAIDFASNFYNYFWPAPNATPMQVAMNAATGAPTSEQIAANTGACVTAIQQMRAQYGAAVPAGAENQCATDQQAYVNSSGGTAQDILANLIPGVGGGSSSMNWTAILVLGGILAGIVLTR